MRVIFSPLAILASASILTGCGQSLTTSDARTEQSITASCRAWEQRAEKAAHPDAETLASHDRLMAKAAKFKAEAQANYSNVSVRQIAIENEVQAELDAEAMYDWRYDLRVASSCWDGLALTQDIHREQQQRLNQLAQQLSTQQQPSPSLAPPDSLYTLPTQPPNAPQPSPVPNLGSVYEPHPVQTWGQTPCAPAIPPAMRDLPVTSTDPMIPEGFR